jgi:hypothetical protein
MKYIQLLKKHKEAILKKDINRMIETRGELLKRDASIGISTKHIKY